MKRVIYLTLALIACFTAIFIGIRLVTQKPMRLPALMTNADGSACKTSCILGISLDRPYKEALALLDAHPLLKNLHPDKDDNYWLFADGRGILEGKKIGIYLEQFDEKVIKIQLEDETWPRGTVPLMPFSEAISSLGNKLFIVGGFQINSPLSYDQDSNISMIVDLDPQNEKLMQYGIDLAISDIDIGFDSEGSMRWCGVAFCDYDRISLYPN